MVLRRRFVRYPGEGRDPIQVGRRSRLHADRDNELHVVLAHVEAAVFARTKNLFACVSDFNDHARHFYKEQGYLEIGPMPNFLIPGSAEILLRKTSGPARENRI